ncbi:cytochrome p450 domain-containing protein [Ditylenchus destructor]|uniref:Cytochrome p450 domain-containing protein n=1 Tax=Ditylenchus destructor TaxID=166010 RepID=A0AAD4MZ27_9BILA|nr:cytochrome p450 domain-containing protein [Ditylenchus destructor]
MILECHVCTGNKIATSFKGLDDIQDHLFSNHHDGPSDVFQFVCHKCDYRFGTEYQLLRHEQTCGRESRSEEALENIRHQLQTYKLIEESIKYNMAKTHAAGGQSFEKMDLQCHICDADKFATSFCSLDELIAHMFSNHQAGPLDVFQFRCHKCDFKFGTEYRLLRHKETCGRESRSAEDTEKIRYKIQMYELLEESLTYNMSKPQTAGKPIGYPSRTETAAANPTSKAPNKNVGTVRNVKSKDPAQNSIRSAINTKSNVKSELEDVGASELEILGSLEMRKRKASSKSAEHISQRSEGIAQQNVNSTRESSNLRLIEDAKKKRVTEEPAPGSSRYNQGTSNVHPRTTEGTPLWKQCLEIAFQVSEEAVRNLSETHQGTLNAQSRIIDGTPLWNQNLLRSANVDPAQIPGFNSVRGQGKPMATSTVADMTNRIRVSGPCLYPAEENPKDCHKRELKAYFGQFGKLISVTIINYEDITVTFVDCEPAAKCLQQRTHKIRGQDFIVSAETPTKPMMKKLGFGHINSGTSNAEPRTKDGTPLWKQYHLGSANDPAQIPGFNSAKDQGEPMATSTAADMTNRIYVYGPCLHPMEENPRAHQREDFRTYFGQFGKIITVTVKPIYAGMMTNAVVTFAYCESAAKCIEQSSHKILGKDFLVEKGQPSKGTKRKITAALEQNMPHLLEESESGPHYPSNLPEGVTNRIFVCGPCLHPEQVYPRGGQNGDLRAYFGQFGAIVNIFNHKTDDGTNTKSKVAFQNCDSAMQCLQQGKFHKICGREFSVWPASPSKSMRRRCGAILNQNMPGPSTANVSAQNVQAAAARMNSKSIPAHYSDIVLDVLRNFDRNTLCQLQIINKYFNCIIKKAFDNTPPYSTFLQLYYFMNHWEMEVNNGLKVLVDSTLLKKIITLKFVRFRHLLIYIDENFNTMQFLSMSMARIAGHYFLFFPSCAHSFPSLERQQRMRAAGKQQEIVAGDSRLLENFDKASMKPFFAFIEFPHHVHESRMGRRGFERPTPLPILGNILTIAKYKPGYDAFLQWQKQYGSVYTYWMAEQPIVAITDYKTIKETFIQDGDSYAGRNLFTEHQTHGSRNGVSLLEGEEWRENRRFAVRALREFGMGKPEMESKILLECDYVIDTLKQEMAGGVKEHDTIKRIELAVGSVINQLLFGYRFSAEREEEFAALKEILDELQEALAKPVSATVMMFSALRKLPIFSKAFKRLYDLEQENQEFLRTQVREYTKKFEVEGLADTKEALPFVGSYLRAIQSANGKVNNGSILFRDDALIQFCNDLWQAGQETTSTTLSFGILYLLLDVDAQSKMQLELDSVVAPDEKVSIAHKSRLPYTNAVVNEVQRLCNLLPQNLYHRTMREVELNGYKLPKSTNVVPQISCVLFDEKIFPEPNRFKPERFLDKSGQLRKVEEFIPFSIGKRICLGESLARMELFLFFANFFHTFKVRPVDPLNPPTSEKLPGLLVHTKPYKVRLELRHSPEKSQMQNGYE